MVCYSITQCVMAYRLAIGECVSARSRGGAPAWGGRRIQGHKGRHHGRLHNQPDTAQSLVHVDRPGLHCSVSHPTTSAHCHRPLDRRNLARRTFLHHGGRRRSVHRQPVGPSLSSSARYREDNGLNGATNQQRLQGAKGIKP